MPHGYRYTMLMPTLYLVQDALVGALMQADESSLASLGWLQDLPQRILHHRQQQQQQHGSQQECEDMEEDQEQAGGLQAETQVTWYNYAWVSYHEYSHCQIGD